ncbi:MAG: pyridoxamine 5'-phosphate oxidase family protein [Kutzneria sp.]|nr:pyridoxamine 5'-phosphate oxidase family protein [Kutzneria sp.]
MRRDDVLATLHKPIAQQLLHDGTLARLAYTGLDGFPRVIPIGFLFDNDRIVVCTTPKAAKVAAVEANPAVALTIDTDSTPPRVLLVRGTATADTVDGVPDEFLRANRKTGTPEQHVAFEREVRALYDRMVRITIDPTWAKLLDFETTLPSAVEELIREKYPERLRTWITPDSSAGSA